MQQKDIELYVISHSSLSQIQYMEQLGKEFLRSTIKRLKYYKELGESTFAQVDDDAFHWQLNPTSNSIAVIIQHMAGNMLSRWTNFLTEDGEKEWRNRDEEFEVHTMNRSELISLWEKGWNCLFTTLDTLNESDLLKTVHIRQEPLIVIDAINRQLAHYPYHVGQIVYIGKLILDENWKSLSIPKGNSEAYNEKMKQVNENRKQ
jgi:hypothetical protein